MRPKLKAIAATNGGVFTRAQALGHYSRPEVEQRLRRGAWTVVRHGIYIDTALWEFLIEADQHGRLLIEGAARRLALGGRDVISHETAAQLHGLSLLVPPEGEPRLTRIRPDGAAAVHVQGLYAAAVPRHHVELMRNVPVTTAARTAVDYARNAGRDAAVVLVESALRGGLDPSKLDRVVADCSGWPGNAAAREVVAFSGPWSDTALESLARCWFDEQGLPAPSQQRVIRVAGRFVACVDFVWEKYRTACEVDGRLKYTELDPDGSALWKEKRREDDLRDAGLEVVRGYWTDRADRGAALAERLRRAFARGLRATGDPAYLIESQPATRERRRRRAS